MKLVSKPVEAIRVEETVCKFVLTEHVRVEWVHPSEFNGYTIYPDYRECLNAVIWI